MKNYEGGYIMILRNLKRTISTFRIFSIMPLISLITILMFNSSFVYAQTTTSNLPKRAKIVGIVIFIQNPDGSISTKSFDPNKVEALFFSERAVTDILGTFYETRNSILSRDQFIELFGLTRTQKVLGNAQNARITRNLLQQFWNTSDENNQLITIMFKQHKCIPGGS